MLKRILKSKLPLIVYNPVKTFCLTYSVSLHDAGALPVMDTEFMDNNEVIKNLEELSKKDILFGIRVNVNNDELKTYLEQYIINLDLIIFSYNSNKDLDNFSFQNKDCRFFLEITDIDMAERINAIDPYGLILKGNEAPGKVSKYTSFILMQWYLENAEYPVFIHGGVGMHTAPGIFCAGANGIVLDDQLFLSKEAPLSDNFKDLMGKLDEADSRVVGQTLATQYRFFAKLGTKIVTDLKTKESLISGDEHPDRLLYDEIKSNVAPLNDEAAVAIQSLFYLGQDGVFAKRFGGECVHDIIGALFKNINQALDKIDRYDPLKENAPLAVEHGTKYPVVQGPMANISDNAEFARKIYDSGALPFLALGSLPKDLSERTICNASERLEHYGAGMIGIETFNATIKDHVEQVKRFKVPFALFAGGVPSQIKELEESGTKAYLHTPSVMMLENAIENGCKRFIFEGMEAGGHIGMLTSFALWESSIEKILSYGDDILETFRLLFAGGITTRFASYFITGMTSILASKGVKIGIQAGSVYLFTREILEVKAIQKCYQDNILKANDTILTGTTVGLTSRTLKTPLTEQMILEEHKRVKDGIQLNERKEIFERGNIGSLLISSKGFAPKFSTDEDGNMTVERIHYDEKEQYQKGNYMVGDSLAFESCVISIDDIHNRYFHEKKELYSNLDNLEVYSTSDNSINDEIAVVGMGCYYPDADDIDQYWDNILSKKCSIKPISKDRFNTDFYYDEDKAAEDKSYSKIAAVVDYTFDHDRFGYERDKAEKLSRSHRMILQTAYQAVENAGFLTDDDKIVDVLKKKTAVIMGSCLGSELGNNVHLKFYYPEIKHYLNELDEFKTLPENKKKAFLKDLKTGFTQGIDYTPVHGIVLNMEAGRIAHHLGIEGVNYTVDAACATSFTAIDCGIKELRSGKYDCAIVGGLNSNLSPETFVGFAKMGALSNEGSFPFDERANGFVLGEGAGVLVLKRMKDAIRDNDRIHCVIKGMGASSDGKGKAIAAPSPKGQVLALKRCYDNMMADVRFDDIDFIEAHGTSTVMGDEAELKTLAAVYKSNSKIGVSSVKSQIGHLLGGAGCAGFIKAAMAVKNAVLPPGANFKKLSKNHELENSPLYILDEKKEWIREDGKTRKAAISSYGFGGINYHCVIEEYRDDYKSLPRQIFKDINYNYNDDRIVVAGLGVVLPGARNTDEFWERLLDGNSPITRIPDSRFHNTAYSSEMDDFNIPQIKAGIVEDYQFNNVKFRIPPLAAKYIDRAQLFGLDAANQALDESGLINNLPHGNKTAVIMGTIPGENHVENVLRTRIPFVKKILSDAESKQGAGGITDKIIERIKNRYNKNTEDTIPGLLSNIISGRIANYFNCNGPNFVVDSSCASSAVATDIAIKGLLSKDLDYAVCGGADANLYPALLLAFKSLGLLSEGDCKFYDTSSSGYIMGEGAAVQVLTTRKKAVENNMPILGEIDSIAFNSSVPSHLLAPSESMFKETIDECYRKSAVKKTQVSHLDVFGFTNYFGDLVEKQAIEASFDSKIYFGNVKHQFGYFKAANPAVVLTKLILMNKNKKILTNSCYNKESSIVEDTSILKPNLTLIDSTAYHCFYLASNVNGIGGNHGHMLVGAMHGYLNPSKLIESEKTISRGKEMKKVTADFKEEIVEYNVIDVHTKYKGAKQMIVALLSGQGAQHAGMMKQMYDENSVIRDLMNQGNDIFIKERGYSLLDMMFSDNNGNSDNNDINLTQNTQPAVFLSTAALYKTLQEKGFRPDFYIGHSVGEYSALYCSGMLDFDDAMKLIIKRSDFMKMAAENMPGKIMVVFKNSKATLSLIRDSRIAGVYIANKNSEKQTAVSGSAQEIERFCAFLKDTGEMYTNLALSGAFHTPLFAKAASRLQAYMENITFNQVDFSRVISNVTGAPYPRDAQSIKALLVKQITSPVEFVKSVENVYISGKTHYIEIGPNRLLSNLLKYINIVEYKSVPTIDSKKGQMKSFNECCEHLEAYKVIFLNSRPKAQNSKTIANEELKKEPVYALNDNFQQFKENNATLVDDLLYQEYLKYEKKAAVEAFEKFNFYVGNINIAGVSVGLPGKGNKVFAADNFDKLLKGTNFIEPLSQEEKEKMADMNVTRLFKQPDGNAKFVEINSTEDVIQLAGQLGYFDINDEYGIKKKYDLSMSLAIAAGIEALKDANIPLVMQYKDASTGNKIPDGFALPEQMQEGTGVIITSLFPNSESFIEELNRYYYNKFYIKPYEEFENIYYHIMASGVVKDVKEQITDWFHRIKERRTKYNAYAFDRNFASKYCPLGAAHLAELIKAKGPNILLSSACASTTQAIGVAEDWIRAGRCDRVIVIGGENATSEKQNHWIGTAFLALGAGTVKKYVEDAAKPFDENRNGTILGAGAVSLIVEREDKIKDRGFNGQAQILGTYIGNSAYHTYNIDVNHLTLEMNKFITRVEKRHDLNKDEYPKELVFMSHETYTPARGGSADAEIKALRTAYPDNFGDIVISNTKGYTGHTLGAAIEDAVLVKVLQKGMAPPIANLTSIPKEFEDLNLNKNSHSNYNYGLHLAAGFGSHYAFVFFKRVEENKVEHNLRFKNWMRKVSDEKEPNLTLIDNTLCIEPLTIPVNARLTEPKPMVKPVKETPLKIKVPEDLKLKDLNTIEKLTEYVSRQTGVTIASSAPAQSERPVVSNDNEVLETAKKIIEEQTGYTKDMLEDDLDLEADLGIDTVKQVEIFGKISSHFKLKVPEDLKLRDLNTISRLSDYIDSQISGAKTSDTVSEIKEAVIETAEKSVKRFVPDIKKIDIELSQPFSFIDKTIILTCDRTGLSDRVKQIIERKGGNVLTIGNGENFDIDYDLTDISNAQQRLREIKANHADINGIIHLAPIDYYLGDNDINDAQLNVCVKSLFLMIQSFYPTLDNKGSIIASMSFDSVVFPYDRDADSRIFPSFAGISGMLKTVNKELENTCVKMVDFVQHDIEVHTDDIANTFIHEIESGDRIVEVGYKENERYGLTLTTEAIRTDESFIKDGDTILVSGGTGGITFEILKKIAKLYNVKFIILGTSDIEGLDESILKRPDRASVMESVKENMTGKPLEIKNAVDKIMRTIDARRNLKALQQICDVDYKSCDVRDFDSVNAVVSEYEKIDGVLHAAGVEQSQFIRKKELTSFNRVMDVKVKGLVNLLKALEGKKYKYVMTFSSVTARFGNEGQIDYTTANDIISKVLINEKRKHPVNTYKVFGWTAWQGAGMAAKDSVMTVLKERGITFLTLEKGVDFFMDELYHADNEAVYTGYDFNFDKDGIFESPFDTDFPFLDDTIEKTGSKAVFNRTLSLDRDLFLLDHSMDGTPIFLGSTGIETMAEAAYKVMEKESNLIEVNDFAIPYGIKILKGRSKELRIESCIQEDGKTVQCHISSVFKNSEGIVMGDPTIHYQGSFLFSEKGTSKEKLDIPEFNKIEYTGDLKDMIYNSNRLFMNGLFETIKDIESFDGDLLITQICDTSSRQFFKGVNSPRLKTDAVIIDAMFQTGGLLEFLSTNYTVLPYKIKRLRLLQKITKGKAYYCFTRKTDDGKEANTYQLDLVDKAGNLYIQVNDFQMVKLQKLAQEHRILDRVRYHA